LPSLVLHYAEEKTKTTQLQGLFRSFAWDRAGGALILVGDKGRILKLQGEKTSNLTSGTLQNLRGVSVNPIDGGILAVGNAGTVVMLDDNENVRNVTARGSQNLRATRWNPDGTLALIAGNEGTLMAHSQEGVHTIDGARANLRRIAWRPKTDTALVTSNCFAEEFIPSSNLFRYDSDEQTLNPLNEGRTDLIGVDWKPDGTTAIVVGYDVIWHNGTIAVYDGRSLSPLEFPNKRVYPVDLAWDPKGEVAAIVTATAQLGEADGSIYLWDGKELQPIFRSREFFFNSVAWNMEGTELVALGSSATRTFNC
jgi:WD40 repeat protein